MRGGLSLARAVGEAREAPPTRVGGFEEGYSPGGLAEGRELPPTRVGGFEEGGLSPFLGDRAKPVLSHAKCSAGMS